MGGWSNGLTDGSVGKSLEHATLAAKVTTTSFQTAPPHSYNKGGPWLFWMANAKATLTKHGKKFHTYICIEYNTGLAINVALFLVWAFSRCFSIVGSQMLTLLFITYI